MGCAENKKMASGAKLQMFRGSSRTCFLYRFTVLLNVEYSPHQVYLVNFDVASIFDNGMVLQNNHLRLKVNVALFVTILAIQC